MTSTAYYMERPASMPMAAPVGAVVSGLGYAQMCTTPSFSHRSTVANPIATAFDGAVKRGMTVKDWQQTGLTTTNRSARCLGRRST